MKRFLLGLLVLTLFAVPAMAATVSLHPIYDLVNQFLQAIFEGVAMAVAGWLMFVFHKYITPLLGAQAEASARDSLNTALANGVKIAMNKVEGVENLHSDVQVKGAVQAWAAQYAIDHAGDAVARFGLDPNQLALKALAFIPPPPTTQDTTGATAPIVPVSEAPLTPAAKA